MKKSILLFSFLFAALFVLLSFVFMKKPSHSINADSGFAVVELFTSEGCSSCPAADEALAKISKEYKNNVYVLGFHVDYWNRLGWKDMFSSEGYTSRQQQYAALFGLNSVYTPQVVVNGKTEFTGSDESRLRKTIQEELRTRPGIPVSATAKTNDGKNVEVIYSETGADGQLLNIALVQLHAETDVKKGENEGRHLLHTNIVRAFKTVVLKKEDKGSVMLPLPQGLAAKDCMVIVFLQEKNTFHVTGSVEVNIQ